MKNISVKPAVEELQELLAASLHEASGEGEKPDYGEPINFDW